jgi:hypothetical protein
MEELVEYFVNKYSLPEIKQQDRNKLPVVALEVRESVKKILPKVRN